MDKKTYDKGPGKCAKPVPRRGLCQQRAQERRPIFNRPFQELLNRILLGARSGGRDELPRKTRSMLNLAHDLDPQPAA